MSNYAEVFHKCGDRFRDVTKLFTSFACATRVTGFNALNIPKIWYKVYKSFYDEHEILPSSFICLCRTVGSNTLIISPEQIREMFEENTLSVKTSFITKARVVE